MANNEDVMGAIGKLTAAIQEKTAAGQDVKTTLQWDDLKKDFEKEMNALVASQVQEKMDAQPQRRGVAGAPVLDGAARASLKGNRYAKMLHDFEVDGYHKDGITRLQPVDLAIAKMLMEGQAKNYYAALGAPYVQPSDDLKAAIKAMDSTTATAGDELVPTNLAGQLWEDFFLQSKIVSTLQRIAMPTNPFDIPLGLGSVTWRKGGENTATTQSNPSTAKVTLTSTELVTEQAWSYTLDEDAVVAMAPAIRARLAQSGAEAMDAFALNADNTVTSTGNINMDDATPPSDSYYISNGQDGIRHQYLVDNTNMGTDQNGALTDAKLLTEMAAMGKYAVDPNKLVIFCDVSTYLNGFLSAASGSPGELLTTIDKFGSNALVLTGQLAAFRGVPIVVTASQPLTETDGKANVAAGAKGGLSIVNRDMWYIGFRRDLLIEMDKDIQRRQFIVVSSFRQALAAWGTRSTNTHTGGLFNITV